MTPLGLAWSNLAHKRTRTMIASAGVAFAVALVFMELGFLGGVERTATLLYDKLRFDLLITSGEYLDLTRPGNFPRDRLAQAQAEPGVRSVDPVVMGVGQWRLPARRTWLGGTTAPGGAMSISLLGVPPERLGRVFSVGPHGVFRTPEEARAAGAAITQLDTLLIDRRSRDWFGTLEELRDVPPDGRPTPTPDDPAARTMIRLNNRRAEVVGGFELGTGFTWNGMLMGSEETFTRFMASPAGRVTFGLVHLAPGADAEAVRDRLRSSLPGDVRVQTRDEVNDEERRYWLRLTSIGQFLYVAVALAVVVGVIFVYQMMVADIRAMLPQYATVKALGYGPGYLTAVVLWQSALLAVLGYAPGFLAALGLFAAARMWGGIPAEMTLPIAVEVLALTAGMCLASGLLAVRRVHTADPADLF